MASYPPPQPPGYRPPGYGPAPAYGPPPGSYGSPYPPTRATNGKAIAALICGIVPITTCIVPVAIAAVILAPMAKREIAAQPDSYDGVGLAQAGQILGWITIGLTVVGVLFFVVAIALSDGPSNDFESLAPFTS